MMSSKQLLESPLLIVAAMLVVASSVAAMVSPVAPLLVAGVLVAGAGAASCGEGRSSYLRSMVVVLAAVSFAGQWRDSPGAWIESWLAIGFASVAVLLFASGRLRASVLGMLGEAVGVLLILTVLFASVLPTYLVAVVGALALPAMMIRADPSRFSPVVATMLGDMTALIVAVLALAGMALTRDYQSGLIVLAVAAVISTASVAFYTPQLRALLRSDVRRDQAMSLDAPFVEITPSGQVLASNPATASLFGAEFGGAGVLLSDHLSGDSADLFQSAINQALQSDQSTTTLLRFANGEAIRSILATFEPVDDDLGRTLLVQLIDQTDDLASEEEQRRRLAELELRSKVDDLTGAANRSGVMSRLEQLLATGNGATVIFLDLDGFKGVNDTFGHDAGDAVLISVARRLENLLGSNATVGRIGGDEFVIVGAFVAALPENFLAELEAAITAPVSHQGRSLTVGSSMGVAQSQTGSAAELLAAADQEMYADKARRKAGQAAQSVAG